MTPTGSGGSAGGSAAGGSAAEARRAVALPPGWPPALPPPGTEEFTRRALGWLFDHSPPDARSYPVFTRQPVALARLAREHLAGSAAALRRVVATARADFEDVLAPPALDELLAACTREAERAEVDARAASLVEEALRGRRWVPKL